MAEYMNCLLHLYRAARDTSAQEFPLLAREMLKGVTGSRESEEGLESRRAPDARPLRGESSAPVSGPAQIEGAREGVLDLLARHLQEALRLNAALSRRDTLSGPDRSDTPACSRALMSASGELLCCTQGFAGLFGYEQPGARISRLPSDLMKRLLRGQAACLEGGTFEILPVRLGAIWLLIANTRPLCRRLSAREHAVARSFGAGQSYKDIATEMKLAPATVRNVVQKIYRKLEINSKAALAKLLLEEE
jgi:DNA-binding CsgD family transcriptional regulator